jgi:hypothetical protein
MILVAIHLLSHLFGALIDISSRILVAASLLGVDFQFLIGELGMFTWGRFLCSVMQRISSTLTTVISIGK